MRSEAAAQGCVCARASLRASLRVWRACVARVCGARGWHARTDSATWRERGRVRAVRAARTAPAAARAREQRRVGQPLAQRPVAHVDSKQATLKEVGAGRQEEHSCSSKRSSSFLPQPLRALCLRLFLLRCLPASSGPARPQFRASPSCSHRSAGPATLLPRLTALVCGRKHLRKQGRRRAL
eukprot:3066987-Pleurochrysis_carterae.AAC.1